MGTRADGGAPSSSVASALSSDALAPLAPATARRFAMRRAAPLANRHSATRSAEPGQGLIALPPDHN